MRNRIVAALACIGLIGGIAIGTTAPPSVDAAETALMATSLSVDFGEVAVGASGNSAFTYITNTGSVPFGPITLYGGGADPGQFNTIANCNGVTLQPEQTCTMEFTFTPDAPGSYSGSATYTLTEGEEVDGETFTSTFIGTGVGTVAASPLSHSFGNVPVGSTSATRTTTITNGTTEAFGPIFVFADDPIAEFAWSTDCVTAMLPPFGTCTVSYTFSPSSEGAFADTRNFSVSQTPNPNEGYTFAVSLTGTGSATPTITASPLSHDFGAVAPGEESATRTTLITNNSLQPFGPIEMFGGGTYEFGGGQNCQHATLPAGGKCEVQYTFSPTSSGAHSETSHFEISESVEGAGYVFDVVLIGFGDPSAATTSTVTPTSVSPTTVFPTTMMPTTDDVGSGGGKATTTTSTAPGTAVGSGGGTMPTTGGGMLSLLWFAVGAVFCGLAPWFVTRRRAT